MRLTIRTNLAMRVLMACAVNEGHMIRRAGIAKAANASENHLAQVVHLLAAGGYIETTRGRAGARAGSFWRARRTGFRWAR